MRKKIVIASIVLVLVLAVSLTAGAIYLSEAAIYYQLNVYGYQKVNSQWHTFFVENGTSNSQVFTQVYCQNKGLFEGNFQVTVNLVNATFVTSNTQSPQLTSSTSIKLPFTLRSGEKTQTTVYFTIDDNVTQFEISVLFQTNQLFIRNTEANYGGQSHFPYNYWGNNTWISASIT